MFICFSVKSWLILFILFSGTKLKWCIKSMMLFMSKQMGRNQLIAKKKKKKWMYILCSVFTFPWTYRQHFRNLEIVVSNSKWGYMGWFSYYPQLIPNSLKNTGSVDLSKLSTQVHKLLLFWDLRTNILVCNLCVFQNNNNKTLRNKTVNKFEFYATSRHLKLQSQYNCSFFILK